MLGDYVEEADLALVLYKSPFLSMVPEITGNDTGEAKAIPIRRLFITNNLCA